MFVPPGATSILVGKLVEQRHFASANTTLRDFRSERVMLQVRQG